MSSVFQNSLFYHVLKKSKDISNTPVAIMGGVCGSKFRDTDFWKDLPIVVFDFETTGLDVRTSRIIEIGAVKFVGQKEVARFSQLVDPGVKLHKDITQITGIDDAMLLGQPKMQQVLPAFHEFLMGSLCVAHNAEFDVGMLFHESYRLGITCDYTVLCTLKLSRALVKIERRNLDALAAHFGLEFESRHRSIGDILVTAQVLWRILSEHPELSTMGSLSPYREPMPT